MHVGRNGEGTADRQQRQQQKMAEQRNQVGGQHATHGCSGDAKRGRSRIQAYAHAAKPRARMTHTSGQRSSATAAKATTRNAPHTGACMGLDRRAPTSFSPVPTMSPAETAPIPLSAPDTAGFIA